MTAKALYAKRKKKPMPERPYHWGNQSIAGILERQEYTGCTCNFKTYSKSYKLKKRIPNEPENMFYLPDTQEAICLLYTSGTAKPLTAPFCNWSEKIPTIFLRPYGNGGFSFFCRTSTS